MAMRHVRAMALVAGLACLAAASHAADFELVETPSIADVPMSKLKPGTIAFADRPGEDLIDPAVGFMRYEDWATARPVHRQFLSLYPGYSEPNVDVLVDGVR